LRTVIVIGSGFAGLSAASFMAKAGWRVRVIEKHAMPGGRARQLTKDGFAFDMGPTWYWMPDVFEKYFAAFGKKVSDYYELKRLDPSYRIYWDDCETDVPADLKQFKALLNSFEKGAGNRLDAFLKEAGYKYKVGIEKLVYKPGFSIAEFADWNVIRGMFRLDVLTSVESHIKKYFKHPRIRQMLEFPVLFLGATAADTPALYSLMNYADIVKGTWYPTGGMYSVVNGMYQLALELGVDFQFSETVTRIDIQSKKAKTVVTDIGEYEADVVIGGADYHFIEKNLLPSEARMYNEEYWNRRMMAPSCLLYYVGLNKKLKNVAHHSLFFDSSFAEHAKDIYQRKEWPENPLFYVSAATATDASIAPAGCENLVFLIPVASGLQHDDETLREKYFQNILQRFEARIGEKVQESIVVKETFSVTDFEREYNSFRGNAYGLANTLMQTAIFRPRCRSKKLKNLFYTGQLTVPGPGVPPSLISGEVVAGQVLKYYGEKS